jgi:hypothetical protein
MASSFARSAVVAALRDHLLAADDLEGVAVFAAPPRSEIRPLRFIWLGAGAGSVDVPTMKVGRKVRDDTFEVNVWCLHYGEGDPDGVATAVGAEELGSAVDSVLADDPHLTVDGIDHVISVTVREATGPTPIPNDTGYEAAMHLVLEAKVRMT